MNAPRKEPLVVIGKKLEHSIFDNISLMVKRRRRVHPLIPKIVGQFKLSW